MNLITLASRNHIICQTLTGLGRSRQVTEANIGLHALNLEQKWITSLHRELFLSGKA